MNEKCLVDFGFSPALGKVKPQNPKKKGITISNIYSVIKHHDDNPIIETINTETVYENYYHNIVKNEGLYCPRMMTITIAPAKFGGHDCLNYLGKEKQKEIFIEVFQKFKRYECPFVACLEYHKYRRVLHAHALYYAKNLNRVKNLKKSIRNIVGKTRSSVKDEKINSIDKSIEYIIKIDENNINKSTQIPEHPKDYLYWLKK